MNGGDDWGSKELNQRVAMKKVVVVVVAGAATTATAMAVAIGVNKEV